MADWVKRNELRSFIHEIKAKVKSELMEQVATDESGHCLRLRQSKIRVLKLFAGL
jgi:hypothetical protein